MRRFMRAMALAVASFLAVAGVGAAPLEASAAQLSESFESSDRIVQEGDLASPPVAAGGNAGSVASESAGAGEQDEPSPEASGSGTAAAPARPSDPGLPSTGGNGATSMGSLIALVATLASAALGWRARERR